MKCTGKHSACVQISIDTEKEKCRRKGLDEKKCHQNDKTAIFFACESQAK